MDIKSRLVGAGAVVLLAGGLFGAAAYANSQDEPAPVVTVAPTIEAEKVAAPEVVVPEPAPPAPVVVAEPERAPVAPAPAPEAVVPEPEPVVEEAPAPAPAPAPVVEPSRSVQGLTGNGDPGSGDHRP